jgi:hypothetical protein
VAGIACAATLAACAQPGPPPGAPPDPKPPAITAVSPESGAVNVRPGAVIFRFDEVIAERPRGAQDLSGIVVVSPQHGGAPRVTWSRDEIYVRVGGGYRPNTVYTVRLLPGVTDLRNNVLDTGRVVVFSTGAAIPDTRIAGTAFDWVQGGPLPRGYVAAFPRGDTTLAYVAVVDSAARFTIANLPPGTYDVFAFGDANTNRRRDVREPYDSVAVTLADSARLELLAFVHDTIGPRLREVVIADSVTLALAFDQPIAPTLALVPSLFTIRRADSTLVPIAEVRTRAAHDSLVRAAQAAADSSPRGRPSADSAAPSPRPSMPSPTSDLVLRLGEALPPASAFTLTATGVQGLLGASRQTTRPFATARVRRDSTATDSTAVDASAARVPPTVRPPQGR